MTPEEFIVYVDNLPDDCIDERTEEQITFHLPKKKYTCPACGSTHTLVDQYRKQVLKGIKFAAVHATERMRNSRTGWKAGSERRKKRKRLCRYGKKTAKRISRIASLTVAQVRQKHHRQQQSL